MSTDFLFVNQSFIRGMASIANLSGTILTNSSDTPEEADAKALISDWSMVGEDIKGALDTYGRQ